MTAASDKDRFEAAVKIITGLPKDGPFQPSNDMKLKFYGLFKQATTGPCTSSQPAFWDVINRAKWGAWKSLGDMAKDEAMRSYVEILKQVVETMTLDSNVQDFLEKMGPMYEFVTDDGRVVSKSADLNSPADILEKAISGGGKYANGDHSSDKPKPMNGNAMANGRSNNHVSSEESELDDEIAALRLVKQSPQERPIAIAPVAIRKIDLEAGSDEEEFDDATDHQDVNIDIIAPSGVAQSSGSHSPLSYDDESTPPRRGFSKTTAARSSGKESAVLRTQKSSSSAAQIRDDPTAAVDRLSPSRKRAAVALGQLLRQLPELPTSTNGSNEETNNDVCDREEAIIRAWSVLRRIHAERIQRAQDNDDDWLMRRLLKRGKQHHRGKSGHRKHRGRDGNGNGNGGDESNGSATGGNGDPSNASDGNGGNGAPSSLLSSTNPRRSQRQLSGESGTSSSNNSSGTDSANLDFDPHVGAVLLRMHRELQHINRQLELVEGILITQQQLIRNVIAKGEKVPEKKMRLGFFSNLPWRTILFIVAWPVVVNMALRYYRMR